MTPSATPRRAAVLVAVVLLVVSCSGGGQKDAAPQSTSKPSAAPSAAEKTGPLTIATPAKKFCEKVDLAAVAELFDAETPRLSSAVEAGEKIRDPFKPGKQVPSETSHCDIRIGAENEGSLYFAVGDPKSSAKNIKDIGTYSKRFAKNYKEMGASCTDATIDGFGDSTAGVQCDPGTSGLFQTSISYAGVFGEAFVTCSFYEYPLRDSPGKGRSQKERDGLLEPMGTFCLDTAKAIAD